MQHKQMNEHMRQCISNCLDCHAICTQTQIHCLSMGGEHASLEHQRLLADCAQACITSADFMLRMSKHHTEYCRICAELCRACADDCERLANGDATMTRCAETCRRCAESCRAMASAMV